MGRIDVRVPDEQKELIDKIAEGEYNSRSEFIREAIRNEIRERIELSQVKEAKARSNELKNDRETTIDHEKVRELAGLD